MSIYQSLHLLANELVYELKDTFANHFVGARKVFARRRHVIPFDERSWWSRQVLQVTPD